MKNYNRIAGPINMSGGDPLIIRIDPILYFIEDVVRAIYSIPLVVCDSGLLVPVPKPNCNLPDRTSQCIIIGDLLFSITLIRIS